MGTSGNVGRPLEDHVFEQVGHAGLAVAFVARADEDGHVDRDRRPGRIGKQQHACAVGEAVLGDAFDAGDFLGLSPAYKAGTQNSRANSATTRRMKALALGLGSGGPPAPATCGASGPDPARQISRLVLHGKEFPRRSGCAATNAVGAWPGTRSLRSVVSLMGVSAGADAEDDGVSATSPGDRASGLAKTRACDPLARRHPGMRTFPTRSRQGHVAKEGLLVLAPLPPNRPTLQPASDAGQRKRLPIRRKPFLSGAEGDRTPNLSIANAALSQLSYGPSAGERDYTNPTRPSASREWGFPSRHNPTDLPVFTAHATRCTQVVPERPTASKALRRGQTIRKSGTPTTVRGAVARGIAVRREFNVLALIKGKERYVFVYDDSSRQTLIDAFRDLAADPESSFSWFDAAVLTDRAREQAASASLPTPTVGSRM